MFFGNFGLTDNLDLGVGLPLAHVSMDANVRATIIRLSSPESPQVHTFVQGQNVTEQVFSEAGDATGIGDLLIRSKYNFYNSGNAGFAAAVDLRLPTGDENDLLGLGTTQAKIYFIWSHNDDRVAARQHRYTCSEAAISPRRSAATPLGVSDEFNFAGGVEFVVNRSSHHRRPHRPHLIDAGTVEARR